MFHNISYANREPGDGGQRRPVRGTEALGRAVHGIDEPPRQHEARPAHPRARENP